MSDDNLTVREMRKRITVAARGRERVDGKPLGTHEISSSATIIRNVLDAGAYRGMSGEDAMTMLAYYALCGYEGIADLVLNYARTDARPPIVISTKAVQAEGEER